MDLVDVVLSPGGALDGGAKQGSGDDRYVFDGAASWAAVIDGATDVGRVRLFPDAESDAARFAELFAAQLLNAPASPNEDPKAYVLRTTLALRENAAKAARVKLEDAPRDSLPTAAATWVRLRGERLEGATLGDTVAIIRRPNGEIALIGEPNKAGEESARARKAMTLTADERLAWLRSVREIHNTTQGYWVFGVEPEAAAHALYQAEDCPAGSRVLLMTDGFYRLVSPYGRYTDARLMEAALAEGLSPLLQELRAMETRPSEDVSIGRIKTSDDATALLLAV